MGNSRGTRYSNVNLNVDDSSSVDYWDFTWADMGHYDAPAFIQAIINITGKTNVTYIGYEQGNSQIFYGIAKNHVSNLNKVIALVPCVYKSSLFSDIDTFQELHDLGIHSIGGDEVDKAQAKVLENLSSDEYEAFSSYSGQATSINSYLYWE